MLVKKSPAFVHTIQRFITVLMKVRHWMLFWISSIQLTSPQHSSLHFTIILPFKRLSYCFFYWGVLTKMFHILLIFLLFLPPHPAQFIGTNIVRLRWIITQILITSFSPFFRYFFFIRGIYAKGFSFRSLLPKELGNYQRPEQEPSK